MITDESNSMRQWPLKILLVHPRAPFMQEKKITIAADCALLVHKELVEKFDEETIIIGCPMLEDPKRVFEKIRMIVNESQAEEMDIYTMEVPCCHAIHLMVDRANQEREGGRRKKIRLNKKIIRVGGEVEEYSGKVDKSMVEAEMRAHKGL